MIEIEFLVSNEMLPETQEMEVVPQEFQWYVSDRVFHEQDSVNAAFVAGFLR
jgi:hypothetical protein